MRKAMIGAKVGFCGHAGYFTADIIGVGNAWVVRANGPVTPGNIIRQNVEAEATHWVMDMHGGFWRPDLGVFVVPNKGLLLTKVGKAQLQAQEAFREQRAADTAAGHFSGTKRPVKKAA